MWLFHLSLFFIFFWFYFVSFYGCTFCMLPFNFVNSVFLSLRIILCFTYSYCYVCSVLGILSDCVVLCIICVNVYCTTATGFLSLLKEIHIKGSSLFIWFVSFITRLS
jgi:hypothetical protein